MEVLTPWADLALDKGTADLLARKTPNWRGQHAKAAVEVLKVYRGSISEEETFFGRQGPRDALAERVPRSWRVGVARDDPALLGQGGVETNAYGYGILRLIDRLVAVGVAMAVQVQSMPSR